MKDDPAQFAVAARLLADGAFVPVTVLLETAWLLTSRYGYARDLTAAALAALLDMEGLAVADEEATRWALGRFAAGADFADMLHLVASRHAGAFATFDRRLGRLAGKDSPVPVEILSA